MCGIAGIVSKDMPGEEILARLDRMSCIQKHRGPDETRTLLLQKSFRAGFGFTRLSILDLETGMQPITARADGTTIMCNGQVYNYCELKSQVSDEEFVSRGDIEVALHLYRRHGTDFLGMLNGMYAGAIYDPLERKLLLFRDRFGIKPLYYTVIGSSFVFCSEIRPILDGFGKRAELDTALLPVFFTYRYIPGEQTMFKGIKCLPPGSYLELDPDSGDIGINRYWEYLPGKHVTAQTIDDASDRFTCLFRDAVKIRMRSDVEVGTFLSGGIDSSAVTMESAAHKPDIRMFTISYDEKTYNELPAVERFVRKNSPALDNARHYTGICSRESMAHLPSIVMAMEEPVSLGTLLPTDQICRSASEHLKVVMTGEGADEIFAGYRKFMLEMAAADYGQLSSLERKGLERKYPELVPYMKIRDPDPVRRFVQSEELFSATELESLLGEAPERSLYPHDAIPALTGGMHPLNAAIAMECQSRLPNYVILRLDKLSMRHSLETRTPFLDYRLAEFAAELPVHLKADLVLDRGKSICRHAFLRSSILDQETAFRRKKPFTIPIADWLASPDTLPDALQDILLGSVVGQQGILDAEYVRHLVSDVSSEGVGPETLVSGADRVFAVLVFSLWYGEFFQ
jgi:asparagine synthase (glutamine-hydrolysing)